MKIAKFITELFVFDILSAACTAINPALKGMNEALPGGVHEWVHEWVHEGSMIRCTTSQKWKSVFLG
jgi:hypothetical protein